MDKEKVYAMSFSKVYPLLLNKAVRKERTEAEVMKVINWLTGYTEAGLKLALEQEITYKEFFENAPSMNPDRVLIKGSIRGVRIENIDDPLMKEIRYLDKLIDELAKGKSIEKILRY